MKFIGIGMIWLGAGIAIAGTAFGAPGPAPMIALFVAVGATISVAAVAHNKDDEE